MTVGMQHHEHSCETSNILKEIVYPLRLNNILYIHYVYIVILQKHLFWHLQKFSFLDIVFKQINHNKPILAGNLPPCHGETNGSKHTDAGTARPAPRRVAKLLRLDGTVHRSASHEARDQAWRVAGNDRKLKDR